MQIHWPLVVSTACQRVGLGLFVCAFLVSLVWNGLPMGAVAATTLALLAVGGVASIFHLQRPQRFFNAFSNMKSHLTQEALITPFLGVALIVCALDGVVYDLGAASMAANAVAALLAVAFLVCTGLAYQMGSRPAWNTPFVLALFLLTAAEAGSIGVAVCAALASGTGTVPGALVLMALACTVACVACQFAYVHRMRSVGYGVNVDATKAPYRATWQFWLATGVAVPVLGVVLAGALPAAALLCAVCAWAGSAVGVAAWTVLFFRGAHKVKMFPMYPVDLNLDM